MPKKPSQKKTKSSPVFVDAETGKRTKTFTTSRGVEVTVSGDMPLLMPGEYKVLLESEWAEKGKVLPDKPTYKITTAAGTEEVHEHDNKTIASDPEAKALWKTWETLTKEFTTEYFDRVIRTIILDCTEFEINPEWDTVNRAKGVKKPPEDEYARKIFYASTNVFGRKEDLRQLREIAFELAGAEQDKEPVRDTFQHSLEKPEGAASGETESG